MDAKMVKIEQIDKEEENSVETLSERKVPNIPALPEFEMEVNTIFRTIRFLICGEQVHDGDIAIPWTRADLDDMVFCVWLYKTGDCVRIIDWLMRSA